MLKLRFQIEIIIGQFVAEMIKVQYLFFIPCLKSQPIHPWNNLVALTMNENAVLRLSFSVGSLHFWLLMGVLKLSKSSPPTFWNVPMCSTHQVMTMWSRRWPPQLVNPSLLNANFCDPPSLTTKVRRNDRVMTSSTKQFLNLFDDCKSIDY